jgi:hypothetical protein
MFVKILTKRNKNIVRETIYECKDVTIAPEGDQVKVTLKPEGKEVLIPYEGQISIYLMNQQGKTIDTFRFGERGT